MSGVAGYIGRDPEPGERLLRQLASAQAMRGRSVGTVQGTLLGVAQRAGSDPAAAPTTAGGMPGTPGHYALVLDGALDNAVDLRAELVTAGRWDAEDGGTDGELALAAWLTWGDAGLARFAGRYAMIIADLAGGTLTLVRDDLGLAPLFYAALPDAGGGGVVAASEIPALFATKELEPAPDEVTIVRYLRHGLPTPRARTCYAGVRRVLPGEAVTVAADGTVTRRRYGRLRAELDWWDRRTRPVDDSARALVAAELRRAVRDRLAGVPPKEVAVPAALLGYVDGEPVTTAPGPGPALDLAELVPALVEPLPGPGVVERYRAVRAAGEEVGVLLDLAGAHRLGGDLALPERVRDLGRRRRWGRVLREVGRQPGASARWSLRALSRRAERSFDRLPDPVAPLLDGALLRRARAGGDDRTRAARGLRGRVLDGLSWQFEFTDRAATEAGVEVRQPLLDAELLRTLFSLDATPSALPPLPMPPEPAMAAWVRRHDALLSALFTSATFAARGWYDQAGVLTAFRAYQATGEGDPAVFWRLASVELWLRGCVDPATRGRRLDLSSPEAVGAQAEPGRHPDAPAKNDYLPNPGRELVSPDRFWARYPLRTVAIEPGEDLPALAVARCAEFFAQLPEVDRKELAQQPWYLLIAATPVSVAQGRTVPVWEVRPGRAARWLAQVAPPVVGADATGRRWHPSAAQVAIEELGLTRLGVAAIGGATGRLLRRPDWFARMAGAQALAVGGPGPAAVYPANVSVRLAPRRPRRVVTELSAALRRNLPRDVARRFGGTVLVAADEQRHAVLADDTKLPLVRLASACTGNPLGQGREQTPFAVLADLNVARTDWAGLNLKPVGWPAPRSPRVPVDAKAGVEVFWPEPQRADDLLPEGFAGFRWEYGPEPKILHAPWRRPARHPAPDWSVDHSA